MRTRVTLATLLLTLSACPPEPHETTGATDATETTDAATGGVIPPQPCPSDPVGKPCDNTLHPDECPGGSSCEPISRGQYECRELCSPNAPCVLGYCKTDAGSDNGYCAWQDSGLPAIWCPELPNCAGIPCDESGCAASLSCVWGECAFACASSDDCGNGQNCSDGKCVVTSTGQLADPCQL